MNVPTPIDNATQRIGDYLSEHWRFSAIYVQKLDPAIALTGRVLIKDWKEQALKAADSIWRPIVDNIDWAYKTFLFFHVASDAVLLLGIYLLGFLVPESDLFLLALHKVLLLVVGASLVWHAFKELK